jgi:lysine 2,3-aminomutase
MKKLLNLDKKNLLKKLWKADPKLYEILKNSKDLEKVRDRVFDYLSFIERDYFNLHGNSKLNNLHRVEKSNAKRCIKAFKNFIRTEHEKITKFSFLETLFKLANNKLDVSKVEKAFLVELVFLLKGVHGRVFKDVKENHFFANLSKRNKAIKRSKQLDDYSSMILKHVEKYKSGLTTSVVKKREKLKNKILKYFNAKSLDWNDYKWHFKNIITDLDTLSSLVKLSKKEKEALTLAKKDGIPFQITPHYLSLFNEKGRTETDRVMRTLVMPSFNYSESVYENRNNMLNMDFMDEHSTSPIDCVTRRYPQILILKPFDSCPQICVYCQRNWEVKELKKAPKTREKIEKALKWIKKNKNIKEVLVTGGDPLTLDNSYLEWLFKYLDKIDHVQRIRVGTRTLVTVPQRINEGFLNLLKKYNKIGKQEICIVTHFEHALELSPDSLKAIDKIRKLGVSVYNQQVYTYYTSRRFETCALRKMLKVSGVDPYYSFNTKGKKETLDFRVPIARIEQERKEEARLIPGLERTDEPVFNVPRLGKFQLVSWQDHELIMLMPDGARVYTFYPWESKYILMDPYNYKDVPIYDYLKRLDKDGEDIREYSSIWYYF